MYSDKKSVLQLVALSAAHGIRKVLLCPGSRNVPLVQSFASHSAFECYSVTDERSAGFFAIGLSLQSHAPVIVCCTSGSALLNLHPAVCEAFYRQVPLVVVSADRPESWIGQMDGQTLPQPGVFGSLVKKSVNLPEIHAAEDEWFCNRLINETLLESTHCTCGPVHINVPLTEPLFGCTQESLPDVRQICRWDMTDERGSADRMQAELSRYDKCMVVSGQLDTREATEVARHIPADRVAWLTEVLGNIPSGVQVVRHFDAALYTCGEEECERLRPDLLITFGGHVVSKRLKKFLRKYKPRAHWHVAPDGQIVDLFCSLTTVVESSPARFLRIFSQAGRFPTPDYPEQWHELCKRVERPTPEYSEVYAVGSVLSALPPYSVLHLANSSVVRLAELFTLPEGVTVQCNRGVNGIEGSLSSAVGYAAASELLNVVLIGDLSFFYDMNALWGAHYIRSNFRIVLLNNGSGGIFHTLPGLSMDEDVRRFVTAGHDATAEGWARSRGLVYLSATDGASLRSAVEKLLDETSSSPVLLEVFTDAAADASEVKRYYHQIKDKIRKI